MTLNADILRTAVRSGRRWSKQYDLTWRYVLNFGPTMAYALERSRLSGEPARVLADLNRDGIAVTSADALLGGDSCYGELCDAAARRQNEIAEDLAAARAACELPDAAGQKPFLYFFLGPNPPVDTSSIWGRFALQAPITAIANAYFGLYCSLCAYNVWYNFVTSKAPFQSQLWHRDPEDRYILKLFMCLSDVDDGAGPFTYAPGTHPKGAVRRQPEYLHKDGHTTRSNDAQMSAVLPHDRWIKGIGPKGTIIFADTRGYHKGGLARQRDRILYIAEYLSPAGGNGVSTSERRRA
jgi:hypothetical protein